MTHASPPDPFELALDSPICRAGLGFKSPHGLFEGNEFASMDTRDFRFEAGVLIFWVSVAIYACARLWWRRSAEFVRAIRLVGFVVQAAALIAILLVFLSTRSRPGAHEHVATLPVVARLLPMSSANGRSTARGEDEALDRHAVKDFEVSVRCQTEVCSVWPDRQGAGRTCSLSPVIASYGPLVLRADRAHDLWFFDGNSEHGSSQVAFRDSDLHCVYPTEVDLPDVVRPSQRWYGLALALLGLGVIVSLVSKECRPLSASPLLSAIGFGLTLLAWVPLLPWLLGGL